ncbi:hypothetical protein, partial [Streptosporangium vulgare]
VARVVELLVRGVAPVAREAAVPAARVAAPAVRAAVPAARVAAPAVRDAPRDTVLAALEAVRDADAAVRDAGVVRDVEPPVLDLDVEPVARDAEIAGLETGLDGQPFPRARCAINVPTPMAAATGHSSNPATASAPSPP